MADILLKVDTAVIVPVNIFPLLDDTDFKTRETAVAYNAAGMDLVWNFVPKDGGCTQTAVTPTTSGLYDWANLGDGIYTIEIPASGGGSINNDTEGHGWFSGVATGVLPWRGPVIAFTVAATVNALMDGTSVLPANAKEIGGTTQTGRNLGASVLLDPGSGTGQVLLTAGAVTTGTVNDKTGYSLATPPPSAADIATAVWASASRTLTSFGTLVSDITTSVWAAGARTLTDFGLLASDTATAVWAAGSRTLTSFGSLVADTTTAVWASASRTLTDFGTLASDTTTAVWAAGARTLTGFGTLTSDTATAVWASTSRTLTDFGTLVSDTATATATAVWSAGARTLTSFGTLVADTTTAVWSSASRTLTDFGTLASDTTTAVWASASRTLTSFGTLVADIDSAVWSSTSRTLTSFGTLVSDTAAAVWAAGSRTLTGFGSLVADTTTAVWSAVSRTLTEAAGGATAQQVWEYATRTLTAATNITTPIAAAVRDADNQNPAANSLGAAINARVTPAQLLETVFKRNPIRNIVAMYRIVNLTCDLILDVDAVAYIKLLGYDGVTETTLLSWNGALQQWDRDPGWTEGTEQSGGLILQITAGAANYVGGSTTITALSHNGAVPEFKVYPVPILAGETMPFTFDVVSGQAQTHPEGQTFEWRNRAVAGGSMGLIEPYASLVTMVGAKTMFAGTYVSLTSTSLGIPDDCEWELGVRTPEGAWDRQVLRHIAGSGGVILQDPNNNLSPVPPGAFFYVVITAGATAVPAGALITLQATNDARMTNRVFAFTPYIAPGASAQGWVRWDGVCYPMDADALGNGTTVRWQIMIDAGTAQEASVDEVLTAVESGGFDPWGTPLPGNYPDGTAGKRMGNLIADLERKHGPGPW